MYACSQLHRVLAWFSFLCCAVCLFCCMLWNEKTNNNSKKKIRNVILDGKWRHFMKANLVLDRTYSWRHRIKYAAEPSTLSLFRLSNILTVTSSIHGKSLIGPEVTLVRRILSCRHLWSYDAINECQRYRSPLMDTPSGPQSSHQLMDLIGSKANL